MSEDCRGGCSECTEDDVIRDFVDAIDSEVVQEIGFSDHLHRYGWAGDNDGTWPFVVERDGRRFEVDINVHAVELTPERVAAREALHAQVMARIAASEARDGEES